MCGYQRHNSHLCIYFSHPVLQEVTQIALPSYFISTTLWGKLVQVTDLRSSSDHHERVQSWSQASQILNQGCNQYTTVCKVTLIASHTRVAVYISLRDYAYSHSTIHRMPFIGTNQATRTTRWAFKPELFLKLDITKEKGNFLRTCWHQCSR